MKKQDTIYLNPSPVLSHTPRKRHPREPEGRVGDPGFFVILNLFQDLKEIPDHPREGGDLDDKSFPGSRILMKAIAYFVRKLS